MSQHDASTRGKLQETRQARAVTRPILSDYLAESFGEKLIALGAGQNLEEMYPRSCRVESRSQLFPLDHSNPSDFEKQDANPVARLHRIREYTNVRSSAHEIGINPCSKLIFQECYLADGDSLLAAIHRNHRAFPKWNYAFVVFT